MTRQRQGYTYSSAGCGFSWITVVKKMVFKETRIIYMCDICNSQYDTEEEAKSCEMNCRIKKEAYDIFNATQFTIDEKHLKLLRRMIVSWDYCEFGAPVIDCKRPYGNSDVHSDIAEIIGIKKDKSTIEYDENDAENYDDIKEYFGEADWNRDMQIMFNARHKEMKIVLQIILSTGKIEVGKYIRKDIFDSTSWEKI